MRIKSDTFDVIVSITEDGKTTKKIYQNVNHRDLLVIFMECSEGYKKDDCDEYAITVIQD